MVRAPPRRPTLGTYPLILAPTPQSNAALAVAGRGTCISGHAGPTSTPHGHHSVLPAIERGLQATLQHSFHDTTRPWSIALPHMKNYGIAFSPKLTSSLSPSSRYVRIESQTRPDSAATLAHSQRATPISSIVRGLTASTHWHDLSLCRDAQRDVARCFRRRPSQRQHP